MYKDDTRKQLLNCFDFRLSMVTTLKVKKNYKNIVSWTKHNINGLQNWQKNNFKNWIN